MPYQDFTDPKIAQTWDRDTTSGNPNRHEHIDLLLTLIQAEYQPGKAILDLGIGSGLVEDLLFYRIPRVQVVGVDVSPAMMALAQERLKAHTDQYALIEHDLKHIETLKLPQQAYQFVISIQTLHHLTADETRTLYRYIHQTLEPGGYFLLLDRIAVSQPALFACYQALWGWQDRQYGSKVVQAEGASFADHERIVRDRGDQPLGLEQLLTLMRETGFEAACLHLQTNRALLAARKAAR